MKKLALLIFAVILASALLCSCASTKEGAPDGMKAVSSSDKLDYNIYIPAAWIQDLSTGAVSAYCSSSDLSNVCMTQYNLEENDTLENMTEKSITYLSENLKDFSMSEGFPENVVLSGTAAKKLEYTASLAGNQYKYMQVICVRGGKIYFFTYTALTDMYSEHTDEVQMILDNFAFKNQ